MRATAYLAPPLTRDGGLCGLSPRRQYAPPSHDPFFTTTLLGLSHLCGFDTSFPVATPLSHLRLSFHSFDKQTTNLLLLKRRSLPPQLSVVKFPSEGSSTGTSSFPSNSLPYSQACSIFHNSASLSAGEKLDSFFLTLKNGAVPLSLIRSRYLFLPWNCF